MFYSVYLQFVLIADKSKVSSKSKNKLLNVVYDFLLYDSFVNIFFISLSKFLYIDKIQKIFIFEHSNGFQRLSGIRYLLYKVICNLSLMIKQVIFDSC